MTWSKTGKEIKKTNSRGLFEYVEELSYLLYSCNQIVLWKSVPGICCTGFTEKSHLNCQTVKCDLKKQPQIIHLPEEVQNSSQLLPLLPSFLSSHLPPPFCQPSLLCSSQRVKEGKVMSGPPGLHCVLALCHCIACRPQTHVQETFLYSQ